MGNKRLYRRWRARAAVAVVLLLLLVVVYPVGATEFVGGDTPTLAAGEVVDDDLFIAGDTVEVNGDVTGDLIAAGRVVVVNGDVGGSLFIAGQTLGVYGDVAGSVYSGGYTLVLGPEASVGRNIYFGGFGLKQEEGSTAGRSLYGAGYQVGIDGLIGGDVSTASGALEINGSVGGDVDAEVSDPERTSRPVMPDVPGLPGVTILEPGFRQGSEASIAGDVDVRLVAPDAVRRDERPRIAFDGGLTARAGEFVAILIVGGLLLLWWPVSVTEPGETLAEQPAPSAGNGCLVSLLFAILVPVAFVMLLALALFGGLATFGQLGGTILSVGGAALGLIVSLFSATFFLLSKVVVSYLGGQQILPRLNVELPEGYWGHFVVLAAGALTYEVLRAIPGLGWVAAAVVIFAGVGAIYLTLRAWWRGRQEMPPEEKAEPEVA